MIPRGREISAGLESSQTYRRDLGGEADGLGDGEVTLLDRALEVDVGNLLAEVGGRADEADEAVFDLEADVRALLDVLGCLSRGLDDELLAPATVTSGCRGS